MSTAVILILAFQQPDGSVRSRSIPMADRDACRKVATEYVEAIEGVPPIRWSACITLPAQGKDA